MNQDIYVDTVSNIYVTGNIVRVDLVALQPERKTAEGQPVYSVTQRIVMPLEGLMQSFALHNDVIKKLVEAGIVNIGRDSQKPVENKTGEV